MVDIYIPVATPKFVRHLQTGLVRIAIGAFKYESHVLDVNLWSYLVAGRPYC